MKMKNVLMILISLAVVFAMVGVVSAATGFQNSQNSQDSTIVKYNVEDSYIIIVPPEVIIPNGLVSTGNLVNATSVLLNHDKTLQVNLTSNNWWNGGIYNLTNDEGTAATSKVPYYINKTNSAGSQTTQVINDTVILSVPAGTPHPILSTLTTGTASIGDYVNLTFQTTTEFISYATKSGYHQDTLTFTCKVVP